MPQLHIIISVFHECWCPNAIISAPSFCYSLPLPSNIPACFCLLTFIIPWTTHFVKTLMEIFNRFPTISPAFSCWISESFVYSALTCSLTSLKGQHIQFFRKNTMRHAIVPHTASALIQRHPDHPGYFWNLQFHRFRLHIFPYVKYFAHLIILKRCPMKKRLRLDPYQSAII